MDTNPNTLTVLFDQLGLPSDSESIKQFVSNHVLPSGVLIANASFWTPSQAAFLGEELRRDSEWADAVDTLAVLLTQK